jgi:hypothetical protein
MKISTRQFPLTSIPMTKVTARRLLSVTWFLTVKTSVSVPGPVPCKGNVNRAGGDIITPCGHIFFALWPYELEGGGGQAQHQTVHSAPLKHEHHRSFWPGLRGPQPFPALADVTLCSCRERHIILRGTAPQQLSATQNQCFFFVIQCTETAFRHLFSTDFQSINRFFWHINLMTTFA